MTPTLTFVGGMKKARIAPRVGVLCDFPAILGRPVDCPVDCLTIVTSYFAGGIAQTMLYLERIGGFTNNWAYRHFASDQYLLNL